MIENVGPLDPQVVVADLAAEMLGWTPPAPKEWVRLRVQFFPDGRCGIANPERASAILNRHVPMGDSAMLWIFSYSHGTRVSVGMWRFGQVCGETSSGQV